jgi:hypothetical protein
MAGLWNVEDLSSILGAGAFATLPNRPQSGDLIVHIVVDIALGWKMTRLSYGGEG